MQKEGPDFIRSCYNPNWEIMNLQNLYMITCCSEAELEVVYKCFKTILKLVQQGALTIQS